MLRSLRLSPVALLLLALAVPSTGQAAQPVVVNSGFERWAGHAATQPPVPTQPLLPEGWAFEGATILFDHAAYRARGNFAAAISGSLSGKRSHTLEGNTVQNPTNPAKDAAHRYYTLPPAWRNAQPIAIKGGATYNLSVWTTQSNVTGAPEYGAVTFVRWLDTNGAPVSVSNGPKRPWNNDPSTPGSYTNWQQISGTVAAPAAARSAILLLGMADDLWTSQVIFDDVSFICTANC